MSSDSNKTPQWTIYAGGIASIATIISVIIAYLAYVHPIASSEVSSSNSTPTTAVQGSNGPNLVPTVATSASDGSNTVPTFVPTQPLTSGSSPSGSSSSGSGSSPSGSSTVDIAGATSTIDAFCNYLNSDATQRAYDLTSSTYQNQHSIDQFTNQFNNADLFHGGCIYNRPTASGNNVIVSLTMNRINTTNGTTNSTSYTTTLVRDPQTTSWVIDSIQ